MITDDAERVLHAFAAEHGIRGAKVATKRNKAGDFVVALIIPAGETVMSKSASTVKKPDPNAPTEHYDHRHDLFLKCPACGMTWKPPHEKERHAPGCRAVSDPTSGK
jgi:hypothetical protein